MAVKIIKGNIFVSQCQTIVNPVNCVGVMGAGIAFEFRLRFPEMYQKYQKICADRLLDIGKLWIYRSEDKVVLNFPTKKDWKQPSLISYLESGLAKFVETYEEKGIKSVAFPVLGAGKGGLNENEVITIMQKYLANLNIDVEIYQYDPFAEDDLYDRIKTTLLTLRPEDVVSVTNLRMNYVNAVITAMKDDSIKQINQLLKVRGVGEKTLEKLFTYANQLKSNTSENIQDSLI